MAKVTDLTVVQQMADSIVDEKCPDLVDFVGRDNAVWCLVAIYTTNDVCKGYGQDFHLDTGANNSFLYKLVSVISFELGVSVIVDSHSSRYQDRFSMCGYESLEDDLTQVAISIQAAIDRIQL